MTRPDAFAIMPTRALVHKEGRRLADFPIKRTCEDCGLEVRLNKKSLAALAAKGIARFKCQDCGRANFLPRYGG